VDGTSASIWLGEIFNLISPLPGIVRLGFPGAALLGQAGPKGAAAGLIIAGVLFGVEMLLFVVSGSLLIASTAQSEVERAKAA
jgi:hypothetical protein